MRFSTTNRLEEHVRLEHIKPPKPGRNPILYCPRFDEQLLKCVRMMNKHNFEVTFTPIDCNADVRGAQRRKRFHRHAYRIQPTSSLPPKLARQDDNVVSSQSIRDKMTSFCNTFFDVSSSNDAMNNRRKIRIEKIAP
ncbi:hypothetical protein COOONC_17045 [Cooperia oncophora]